MKGYNWRKVFFSDEKTFCLGSAKTHSWQVPGKRKKRSVKRHTAKIHVWAAAGYYMKSKLYIFTSNLTSELYRKIISRNLQEKNITYSPDCPARLPGSWQFLQDNDPKHKAKKTMTELEDLLENRVICHPAQSPDLNVMEDLWSYLDRKVKRTNIKTIAGLKKKLTILWEAMPWSVIRTSVVTMNARLAECEKLRGERTHY